MKSNIPTAAILLLASTLCAQDATESEDPIEAAIRAFNNRDESAPNEVIVVLDPPKTETSPTPSESQPEIAPTPSETPEISEEAPEDTSEPPAQLPTDSPPSEDPSAPVLVTGKPPEGSKRIDISDIPLVPDDTLTPAPDPQQGLEVRVETMSAGTGTVDSSKVKLIAPFPAKALGKPPAGWHLQASNDAPAFQHQVELSPGSSITLTIRPHLLVPDADGSSHFAVAEPGFNASLGYSQCDTVGAALSQSLRQLEQDSKQLGAAIEQLQQLLVTLPAEPKATDKNSKASQP